MSQTLKIELIAPAAQLARDLRQMATAMNQVAAANRSMGGGGGSRTPAIPGANGPFTRLYQLNNQLGAPNRMTLAQAQQANMALAQQRAQAQVNRAMGVPAPFGQRLNNFVRSTRFGNGVSPLIGRTADLLGGGSGPVSAAVGVAAAAVIGLAMAAKQARETLTSLAGMRGVAGGSIASASAATRLGAAIGLQGGDVAAMARSTMSNIASGGAASTYAAGYGVRSVTGMGDPANKIDRFIRLIEGVANDPNEERAQRAAQALGVEEFLKLRDLTPETREKVFQRMKGGASKLDAQAAAEFNAQLGMVGDSFQRIATKLGTPVLRVAAAALEKIADAFDYIAENAEAVKAAVLGPILQIVELLVGLKGNSNKAKKDNPIDRNTDAVNENTRALNGVRETFGGGDRARSGPLKAWSSREFQDRYMKAQAGAMGAFSW
jgi:hypothetical protein